MSISSAFLWRFLDDVWDLLPSDDRQLFETYWSAQLQIAGNLEQKVLEAGLSTQVATVPVFLTERWNRFVMDEDACDLFQATDAIVLTLLTPGGLSKQTAFYDTLKVSTASGQIPYEEDMIFFDGSVRKLRYSDLVAGSVSVRIGALEFTPNRDYVVNVQSGTIQALETGRIPIADVATIRYQHRSYTRGLDYDVDETYATLVRLATTTIASGATVSASYTYNNTATLPLAGEHGAVSGTVLTDPNADFSAIVPGRKLTITIGPNAGTYTINAVLAPTELQTVETFPVIQATDVVYAINAFPHGMKVDKTIVSIPILRNLVDEPTSVLVEGVDYIVRDGILSARAAFQSSLLGPVETRLRQMWAETTKLNRETPYRNFGVLIDFYRKNSEAYKLALQGLWYTFWTGSTPGNLQRGLHILLGLPFAKRAGTVTRLDLTSRQIDITDPRGQIITYSIPSGLDALVALGDRVSRFARLTTGVNIIDRNNEPGFVAARLGRAGISRFLTSKATRGPGNTDETKALTLLEHHLFLPQVLADAITMRVNVTELVTFLDNMKPEWTQYIFSFAVEEDETLFFSESTPPIQLSMDLTATVSNNEWNQSFEFNNFLVNDDTGEVLAGGTQAMGNFRDLDSDFSALNVDTDDTVRIGAGTFRGYWTVLKRISQHVLSLDIPDALIVGTTGLSYVLIPSQRNLGHDQVGLGIENVNLPGTIFSAPAILNTKTNADLAGAALRDADIKGLVLLDIGNAGHEIQDITASNKTINEISVATPPALGAQVHAIASCGLKRTNNVGPAVTDVYAI